MKTIAIKLINLYRITFSVILKSLVGTSCRFEETCSMYAERSIKEFGVLKGTYLSFIRILKCQPFYSAK